MQPTIYTFLIVCPLVFLAGFVDAVAGGGGLISLPAYLLAGVPVHNAVATNKLSSATGTLISTVRLCKNKFVDWILVLPCIPMALLGSSIGAHLALIASDKLLRYMLIPVLPVASRSAPSGSVQPAAVPAGRVSSLPRRYSAVPSCSPRSGFCSPLPIS